MRNTSVAEKYIVIAHPIDFACKALSAFLKDNGFKPYELEVDDDIAFRAQDLVPVALIIHSDFKHQKQENSEIIEAFNTKTHEISGEIDPQALASQIKHELESH